MTYTVLPATLADLPALTRIMQCAMSTDPFWTAMKGTTSAEDVYASMEAVIRPNVDGSTPNRLAWKVVDENGEILGWTGLGTPSPTNLQREAQKTSKAENKAWILPPECRNEKMYRFFWKKVLISPTEQGYDPTIHFQRRNIMVHPDHHHKGLGTMLSNKLHEVVDAANGIVYARARPSGKGLFVKMGYVVLEETDVEMMGEERTKWYVLRREKNGV